MRKCPICQKYLPIYNSSGICADCLYEKVDRLIKKEIEILGKKVDEEAFQRRLFLVNNFGGY